MPSSVLLVVPYLFNSLLLLLRGTRRAQTIVRDDKGSCHNLTTPRPTSSEEVYSEDLAPALASRLGEGGGGGNVEVTSGEGPAGAASMCT